MLEGIELVLGFAVSENKIKHHTDFGSIQAALCVIENAWRNYDENKEVLIISL